LALAIAGLFQALTERGQKVWIIAGRPGAEEPDDRHRWLLRTSRERPTRRRAGETGDGCRRLIIRMGR
jgi:hypothetical protein